ncbi:hypothetical protein ACFYY8_01520 [Streptosporangium sp. NPDC001559]|uniref:hypothetical protein n=1 Tax=Streptosporangium sp. NPDC001559 TaxID=3366187 RepID=UPI0036ED0C42
MRSGIHRDIWFGRALLVTAIAVLAGPLMTIPAAHADGDYTCSDGTRYEISPALGWSILAGDCTGWGDGGPAQVTITSGPYAGTYSCHAVRQPAPPAVYLLSASRC